MTLEDEAPLAGPRAVYFSWVILFFVVEIYVWFEFWPKTFKVTMVLPKPDQNFAKTLHAKFVKLVLHGLLGMALCVLGLTIVVSRITTNSYTHACRRKTCLSWHCKDAWSRSTLIVWKEPTWICEREPIWISSLFCRISSLVQIALPSMNCRISSVSAELDRFWTYPPNKTERIQRGKKSTKRAYSATWRERIQRKQIQVGSVLTE